MEEIKRRMAYAEHSSQIQYIQYEQQLIKSMNDNNVPLWDQQKRIYEERKKFSANQQALRQMIINDFTKGVSANSAPATPPRNPVIVPQVNSLTPPRPVI